MTNRREHLVHESPGWRFFENTNVTESTNVAVHVRFDLNTTNTYMNMFAPAGVAREYTQAVGPPTREASGGYLNKKTRVLAVRQQGEAWDKPYVHIFEPSKSTNTSVKSTEYLYRGEVIVGAKVESHIGDKVITDYVICQEDASKVVSITSADIEFTGHFAIVRHEQILDKAYVTLYIGEGTRLSYRQYSLDADLDNKGQKFIEVDDTDTEEVQPKLLVYPNPTANSFTIELNDMASKTLDIYNVLGAKVYSNNSVEDKLVINAKEVNMTSGLFFIVVHNQEGEQFIQKLIVK